MLPLMSKITPMEIGHVFTGKGCDLLLDPILVDAKVFFFEAGDQAPVGVGYREY